MKTDKKEAKVNIVFEKENLDLEDILKFKDDIYKSIKLRRDFDRLLMDFSVDRQKSLSNRYKALTRKGAACWIVNKIPEAIKCLEEARAGRETDYFLSLCYLDSGQPTRAYELLEALYKDDPDSLSILIPYVDAKIKIGNPENIQDVLDVLTKAKKLHRNTPDLYYYSGLALEYLGEHEQAQSEYKHALRIQPGHTRTLFQQAYNADLAGRDEDALEGYEKLRKKGSTYINTLLNLGILYEDKGEYEKAVKCYQTVLEYYPNHPRARLYLSDAQASMNMYYDEEAKRREIKLRQVLNTPIAEFQMTVRSRAILNRLKVKTLGDLARFTEKKLLTQENFGMTSLAEIKGILARKGLILAPEGFKGDEPILRAVSAKASVQPPDVLNKSLSNFEWSVRTRTGMESLKVYTIGDLIQRSEAELLGLENFGRTSLDEIKRRLASFRLSLKPLEE